MMAIQKKIIFTTPKNISAKDKWKLSQCGFVVIEVRFLSEIKYTSDIEGDIMRQSAMYALLESYDTNAKALFLKAIYNKLYPKSTNETISTKTGAVAQ